MLIQFLMPWRLWRLTLQAASHQPCTGTCDAWVPSAVKGSFLLLSFVAGASRVEKNPYASAKI
jgi:hypothetical protein